MLPSAGVVRRLKMLDVKMADQQNPRGRKAGPENNGPISMGMKLHYVKMQEMKMQGMKLQDTNT